MLMTAREHGAPQPGERYPEHSLDYFHGCLSVSPDGARIIDDGWVWSPFGVPRSWSVQRWLDENPWESEDGPTVRRLGQAAYGWDRPLCWLDERTVALWGYGDDEEWMVDAALIIDVDEGRTLRWFAGPHVARRQWRGNRKPLRGFSHMAGLLFAAAPERGIEAWDVASGELLARDALVEPYAVNVSTREFLSVTADGSLRISTLIGSA